jgi:formate hydrogenlyase subunit 3/multisubunit Na+/H+ antiporter MnhD subunit
VPNIEIDLLVNVVGTCGVFLILIAYWLLQTDKILSNGLAYSLCNLVGSIMIFFSLMRFWNLPSVIIETCWIAISLYGLYKWKKNSKKKQNS